MSKTVVFDTQYAGSVVEREGSTSARLVPLISDLDIWRAANLLIRQHGGEAELEAARRADLMRAALVGRQTGSSIQA